MSSVPSDAELFAGGDHQKLLLEALSEMGVGLFVVDASYRVRYMNRAMTEKFGDHVGRNCFRDIGKTDAPCPHCRMDEVIREGRTVHYQPTVADGRTFDIVAMPIQYPGGEVCKLEVIREITDLKENERRLEEAANYDALTRLPNRSLITQRLEIAIAQANVVKELLAVCSLDLDGFKYVNDTYGRETGDRLLIEATRRLCACLRSEDTVGRIGGDEFVLLLGRLKNIEECEKFLNRILRELSLPYPIQGTNGVTLSASIGVSVYPLDASTDADTLLRHADQAMHAAKQAGRNRYQIFDVEHDRRTRAHQEVLNRIQEGLDAGEFRLHYQPKVNMRRGTVIGFEALIRWQHPEQGLLSPMMFLPVVEHTDFTTTLGEWVIDEALCQLEAWSDAGLHVSVSVNIFARHLLRADFPDRLALLLSKHPKAKPSDLELEILETTALDDMIHVTEIIERCRRLGVGFALDDFGTGYSSLTYFKRLPAHVLKIDQSFVRDMLDDPEDMSIVEGVIGLATAFQRSVVAEGVETTEHGVLLLQLGCDLAQGYGIARPMPAENVLEWVRNFRVPQEWINVSRLRWPREDFPLLAVEVVHKRWIDRVATIVNGPSDGSPHPPPLDCHQCRFGRWLDGPGFSQYSSRSSFMALFPLHEAVHVVASDLLALHATAPETARARLPELLDARDALVNALHILQAEVVRRYFGDEQ